MKPFPHDSKMNFIHLVLSLAILHKWEVHQMDVKSSILHGYLQEIIYMERPLAMFRMTMV
jgi:hypothetical protein